MLAMASTLCSATDSITVTIDGRQYQVSTVYGSYVDLNSTLTQSLFYGNSAFAQSLSNAVAAQLPGVWGSDTGPGFNYGYDTSDAFPNGRALTWVYITGPGPQDLPMVSLDEPMYWALVSLAGPSVADTQASFVSNAYALRHTFNLQSAKIVQGLSYDCMVYDQKNICVTIIGANSDGKGFDAPSGALVVGYKLNENVRFGAYVDQSFDSASFGGLATDKSDPGYGVYGAWSQNADGSGYQVRAAANISKVDIESTRVAVDSAEAGFGQSSIKSEGIQLDVARSYEINSAWSVRPYVGYRKTTNTRSAYVETDSVEAPLSYDMLKQRTEMLVSGVTIDRLISTRTSLSLTAGVEYDLDNHIDSYQAVNEDIGDIEPIVMDSDVRKTRPSVSLGLNHDIGKAQRIGLSVSHRREAFDSESTTSGYVQYSIGF